MMNDTQKLEGAFLRLNAMLPQTELKLWANTTLDVGDAFILQYRSSGERFCFRILYRSAEERAIELYNSEDVVCRRLVFLMEHRRARLTQVIGRTLRQLRLEANRKQADWEDDNEFHYNRAPEVEFAADDSQVRLERPRQSTVSKLETGRKRVTFGDIRDFLARLEFGAEYAILDGDGFLRDDQGNPCFHNLKDPANPRVTLASLMKLCDMSSAKIAHRAERNRNTVLNLLKSDDVPVDEFRNLLHTMGYSLYIRAMKYSGDETKVVPIIEEYLSPRHIHFVGR